MLFMLRYGVVIIGATVQARIRSHRWELPGREMVGVKDEDSNVQYLRRQTPLSF